MTPAEKARVETIASSRIRTPEFDAFGPWLLPVTSLEEVPPIFRYCGYDPAYSVLAIKVPRNIERRNAHPLMNLYDYFLDARPDGLAILTRTGDFYDTDFFRYEDILAISNSATLLLGELSIIATWKHLVIPYSTASIDVMEQLLAIIRKEYVKRDVVSVDVGAVEASPGTVDFRYGSIYKSHLMDSRFQLVSAQPTVLIESESQWGNRKNAQCLAGSLIYMDGRELEIVHCRDWIRPLADKNYSIIRTTIPLENIVKVVSRKYPGYPDLGQYEIYVGVNKRQEIVLTAGDAETALKRALGLLPVFLG